MKNEYPSTCSYPDIELHEIGVDGTICAPVVVLVRDSGEARESRNTPDLVIVSSPLSSALAQQGVLRIARQQKKQQQALFVAVCDVMDMANALPAASLQALYAEYDAVLVVETSQRRQVIDCLIRTIATLDEPDQWLTCDWSDIRHILQAPAARLVRYGSACRVGAGCATAAAADAIKNIEDWGPGWCSARGISIGIQSASKEVYGRDIKDVLAQVRAALDPDVTITLSARYNGDLEPGAVEVNIFAFGERSTAQLAADDGRESEAQVIDGAALAWTGEDGALDPLYSHARSLVLRHQRASISLIQRHLRIGYRRASRLVDAMEGDLLSAKDESGLRKVLDKHLLNVPGNAPS